MRCLSICTRMLKSRRRRTFQGKESGSFRHSFLSQRLLASRPSTYRWGDIYTAMERGAVDGFVMTHFGFVNDFDWHEVSKYVIDYPLYQGTAIILANPKKWGQLPPEVQKGIIDLKKESIEQAISDYYAPLNQKDWKLMTDEGSKRSSSLRKTQRLSARWPTSRLGSR